MSLPIASPEADTLYVGDCLAVMRQWSDACIDHAIIDPPYGVSRQRGLSWRFSFHTTIHEAWDRFSRPDYLAFSQAWLAEACRVVKPNGNLFIFGSYRCVYDLGHLLQNLDRKILNSIIWLKPNAQPSVTCRSLTESTEQLIWAANAPAAKATGWVFNYPSAKRENGGKQLRNYWSIPVAPARERRLGKHPAQKPLALIERIVRVATRPGEVILDPFAGTGTTGVAAARLGRRYVLIERHPAYAAIAQARLAAVATEIGTA